jgi:hypothetical protein
MCSSKKEMTERRSEAIDVASRRLPSLQLIFSLPKMLESAHILQRKDDLDHIQRYIRHSSYKRETEGRTKGRKDEERRATWNQLPTVSSTSQSPPIKRERCVDRTDALRVAVKMPPRRRRRPTFRRMVENVIEEATEAPVLRFRCGWGALLAPERQRGDLKPNSPIGGGTSEGGRRGRRKGKGV